MAAALTLPHAIAALVLCVAGVAKLRAPAGAASAVSVPEPAVRAFAALELGIGAWALVSGARAASVAMALLYLGFAGLTLRLARAGEACGCFGAPASPASPLQSLLSATLAGICALAAAGGVHGLSWILGRSPGIASVLVVGTAGAVYGIVLAYSELPQLWGAWGGVP